jgi:hypothetical protein
MRSSRLRFGAGTVLAAFFGAVAGAAIVSAVPAIGQTATQWIQGGGYAGPIAEPKFGFTSNDGKRLAVTTSRELFKVPDEYGEPFAVTVANSQTTVWYRHAELGVRNVTIQSDQKLVHILHRAALKTETPPERAR